MHIHQHVLEVARQLTAERKDFTFGLEEVVRALPHLGGSSVRTHVVSRCCVNAPKNHAYKLDYFKRVGRGKYQLMPKYRREEGSVRPLRGQTTRLPAVRTAPLPLRDTIHAVIQKDGEVYVADCLEIGVVTQGNNLDETVRNLTEAVMLHLDGEDLASMGLTQHPRVQLLYEVPLAS